MRGNDKFLILFMINLNINRKTLKKAVSAAQKAGLIIPTFGQLKNPDTIPDSVKQFLSKTGLWDSHPVNLFRTTWKNEPVESGGLFGRPNYMEIPKEISGIEARIIALTGKWFPTGAHKVGAAFACLVPKLITGGFDPFNKKAVWPSTGNYCRGGAYISGLLGCDSIAILPEEMSSERFDWLSKTAGEVIKTPGSESNVKEIYDKCHELRNSRNDVVIFNQFDEPGNYLWHYEVTGGAINEILKTEMKNKNRFAGFVSSTGSSGTLAAGDLLKEKFPGSRIAACEALQCPTLLRNGFGAHRIEGIGDKHVPWIHNVKNTDMVIAVDDNKCLDLIRLFNEPAGKDYLIKQGLSENFISMLPLIGISGSANLLASIKFAKYYELNKNDIIVTVFTDSMDLYGSRIEELRGRHGEYTSEYAIKDYYGSLHSVSTDNLLELNYYDKKRIHNLKYFTWIEQQGKDVRELNAQWYDYPDYWKNIQAQSAEIDTLIGEFNKQTGLS